MIRALFGSIDKSRLLRLTIVGGITFLSASVASAKAAGESNDRTLRRDFAAAVHPFLKSYCLGCHDTGKQEGKLDLSTYATARDVANGHRVWEIVLDRLEAEEMPPAKAKRQPSREQRQAVIDWIRAFRTHEADLQAGDPGPVLARRLSNAEYDYTIRDLTGVDIRPTREFPIDPANEAGFDNSGESLTMSPALVKKYLEAARVVADHVVLKPRGFVFAPHPAVTETDRDRFCVQRIVDFYQRHQVDYADYFFAAWQFQHRAALGKPTASLNDFAFRKLSAKYLATIWFALNDPDGADTLAELQGLWKKLSNDGRQIDDVRRACETMRDFVIKRRKEFEPKIDKLQVKGISDGSQPLVLWRNRELASRRMSCQGDGEDSAADAARAKFCRVFPSAFAVSSRGHYADANLGAQVRLLSAGFHLMQGYFRDDQPLCELVLDDAERAELDSLWQQLNFVTLAPVRQYKDYLFFERAEPPRFAGGAEFDFARPEDKDVTSESKLNRFRDVYLAKARKNGASDQAVEAIETFFANMNADIRWIERARRDAEQSHLESLAKFAERAYRRPLSASERDDLLAFYRMLRVGQPFQADTPDRGGGRQAGKPDLRSQDGLSHEDAIRDSIVSVLMSPHFCFRFDLAAAGEAVRPLTDYELASRLSYFLWSSMPDDELLARAAVGDLHQPEVLVAQTRRMLRDPRIRGLATEFSGNWLDIRRFEEHNSVDRDRFASFTNELREAMFEEPIRFFIDVARESRSVLDFLHANHTFVNPILAKHYGIDVGQAFQPDSQPGKADLHDWIRIDDARRYGRGGLLPMAVFLTKNSPGLRTSPVKRGYWVVRRLLGEHIPAPPPEVPELPKDEAQLGALTLPQVLARHRDNKACAGCHQRFDSIGLVFEGYGPIGERRDKDLGGRPVDPKASFPDGSERTGVDGLRRYLADQRQDEFVDNLIRKLFVYALGRSLLLSDKQTIEQMPAKLAADDERFGSLIESIVTSPQFLKKRRQDHPTN
jgi:mono/diheme cytochrome c family protein